MTDFLLQEDGTSRFLLEDGSGALLLESSAPPEVDPSFIGSVTVVRAPTVVFTNDVVVTTAGMYQWLCPAGVTTVYVEAIGGGGPGGQGATVGVGGAYGGGGGAYSARESVPVTPGTLYTFVVGSGGDNGALTDGASSTFTGDSSVQVIAVGGAHGTRVAAGSGGAAGSCTGDTGLKFSGGDGGAPSAGSDGGGGGASGNRLANGSNGANGTSGPGVGGTGANGGGSGGTGGHPSTNDAQNGTAPGGGGGGGGTDEFGGDGAAGTVTITLEVVAPFISSVTTVYAPTMPVQAPFIGSVTVVYAPTLPIQILPPFIGSNTLVYTPDLPEVHVPFIPSNTHVWHVFSVFDPNKTYGGPGNGGESFAVRLNANGVTNTATLLTDITATAANLRVTGDGSFPAGAPFVVTIDAEVMLVYQIAPGSYHVRLRGISNTAAASHTAGAGIAWGDSYEQGIVVTDPIAGSFTAPVADAPSDTYPGWLVAFDSSQGYLAGDRYPMHVDELLGVFAADAGSGGSNKTDGAQPSAVHAPNGVSDDCPVGLTVPARITTDINIGDVAVVRYTNPEVTVLDLGPRSVAIQSWFGMKRVDLTDGDVTFTNPNGIVVDTTGGFGTYTGSVDVEETNPLPLEIGIAPDASDAAGVAIPTPNPVPWITTTLSGTDRYFTRGSGSGGYDETGWPFGMVAVRQGNKRVPFWQSWAWHDFSYVYDGFGTDSTFAQIVVNRNGVVYGSLPAVALPGAQDIDGPDAVWDDPDYFYSAAWYVAIVGTHYLVAGPAIGGTVPPGPGGEPGPFIPYVIFGTGPTPGPPIISVPPIEGGQGGDISPSIAGLHVWQTS